MAYEIIGSVFRIGNTETITTKSNTQFQRRSLTLMQKRFDPNTGLEYDPNYPTIDFTQRGCAELDRFKQGDMVRVRFDISGTKYADRQTGAERFFTSLRGYRIEAFTAPVMHYQQQQPVPQPQYRQPVPQAPQQPQQPPQGQWADGLPF